MSSTFSAENLTADTSSLRPAAVSFHPTRGRFEPACFYALLVLSVIPIWLVSYLPFQDGPAHLYNADIIRTYFLPQGEPQRQFFELIRHPIPNLLGHLMMAAMMIVIKPVIAEKLTVCAYVLLIPLAARYAFGALRPDSKFLSVLAFPIVYSRLHNMGFYNFNLGLGFFFLAVGYWIRHRRSITPRHVAVFSALFVLLCLTHLFPLMALISVLGPLEFFDTLAEFRATAPGAPRRRILAWRLAALVGLPLFAGIAALVVILHLGQAPPAFTLGKMARDLLELQVLISFRRAETVGAIGFGLLLAVLILATLLRKASQRDWNRWDVMLPVAALLAAFYLHARDAEAARYILPPRLVLLVVLVLILWLAGQSFHQAARPLVVAWGGAITLFMLILHTQSYLQLDPYLREYVSVADQIRPGAVFLPVDFSPHGRNAAGNEMSLDTAPFLHLSSYIAVASHSVDISNYEAHTRIFPLRFWPGLDVLDIMPQLDAAPPQPRIRDYEARTGRRIDYVLIWGQTPHDCAQLPQSELGHDLSAEFAPVATSRPFGLMQVYARLDRR